MGRNKHVQSISRKRPSLFAEAHAVADTTEPESNSNARQTKTLIRGKSNMKHSKEMLDEYQIENMILRITLPQTIKVLIPVSTFVICNHACK